MQSPRLSARCVAEVFGTFLLVFFGCGVVHTAVLFEAQAGLWQVAVVWSIAIAVAVFAVGGISGAHINPAITVALAAWGRFPWRDVAPYAASQTAGAVLAAALLFGLFHPFLSAHEESRGVVRGEPGSEITAMCYGEYFPSPGGIATDAKFRIAEETGAPTDPEERRRDNLNAILQAIDRERNLFGVVPAFVAEVIGTAILALVAFALTDPRNAAAPAAKLTPAFIGLTVGILISVLAPLTQACFNPARDFGPRLVAYFAGWGRVALPGPQGHGFFTVYILAPVVGAVLGGGVYHYVLAPGQPAPLRPEESLADLENQHQGKVS